MFFGSFSNHGKMDSHEGRRKDTVGRFPHHYIQQQQQKPEAFSDEVRTGSSRGVGRDTKRPKTSGGADANQERALVAAGSCGDDGATIEVAKRQRGRPPGSKNKPKPPVVITREAEPAAAMCPHVIEIPSGYDLVDSLARFSRRRNLGICVLACTGTVTNVTLRQPSVLGGGHQSSPAPGDVVANIVFRGGFEILSISATFFPLSMAALSPATASGSLSILLAGPQGQIVGGTVSGPLMASGTVVVMAAAFSSPTFYRLPAEDDVSVSMSVSGGGSDDHEEHDQHVLLHNKHQQQHHQDNQQQRQRRHSGPQAAGEVAAESSGMPLYSGHLPSDVIWAPTARPPPPPPY